MLSFAKKLSGLLIPGILLFSACKSSETEPTDSVSLGLRQSVRLGSGVAVRVDSIQDSRCPINANCFWAGQAKVDVVLSKNSDARSVRLILGPDIKEGYKKRLDSVNVSLANQFYNVILREVNPYPGTSANGQPQTAVLQISPL